MAFMSLEIFFSKKIKVLLNFAFFSFFIYLLPIFINKRLHNKLSVLAGNAVEHILMAIVWPYVLESIFCRVLIDYLFIVNLLFSL